MKKPVQLDEKGHPKFGMIDKIAYAAGDFGCNMSFGLKGTVQTFWLTYMMLETGLLSVLLLLVQIWDAVNDPIIGAVIDADTRRYKRGKFKTYILVGAIGLILGGAAVFLPFLNASTFVKAMLFIVGYVSELGTTGQSAEVAHRACWLVAGLYLFSTLMQFVGIGVIFNLDKKTLAKMNDELNERRGK